MRETDILNSIKKMAKTGADAAPYLIGGAIMTVSGGENRKFWIDGLVLDAWEKGISSKASLLSIRMFPEAEQLEAMQEINAALFSYQRRQAAS